MKPIAILLLLAPLTLFAGQEDVKPSEKAKVREYNKDTGLPIYDEDETKPIGIVYHIRSKTLAPESTKEPEKIEIKEKTEVKKLPVKEREYASDGYPVYDEDETKPVGVVYHLRNKTYISATSGFT